MLFWIGQWLWLFWRWKAMSNWYCSLPFFYLLLGENRKQFARVGCVRYWLVEVAQPIILSPTILLHSQCLPVPSHPHPSNSTLMIPIYWDTCSHQSHKLGTISPVSQSQRQIRSWEYDTIWRASAEKTARSTMPFKGPNTMLPLCESQTRMVLSEEADTISRPSEEKMALHTALVWPSKGPNTISPVSEFQTRIVLSSERSEEHTSELQSPC